MVNDWEESNQTSTGGDKDPKAEFEVNSGGAGQRDSRRRSGETGGVGKGTQREKISSSDISFSPLRAGGQWRIGLKDALLQPRLEKIDNVRQGRDSGCEFHVPAASSTDLLIISHWSYTVEVQHCIRPSLHLSDVLVS
jgi:hypothetical protein